MMKTFLRIGLFLLILLAGVSALAIYWTFYLPRPDYSKNVQTDGIDENVDIHWDPYGVPHIYAQNEHDLYYAVGYVHARDRLWQMTLSQIAAEGRFAEFLGEEFLDIDKYQRTLGFWNMAVEIESQAPDSLNRLLQAYSDGINDYAEKNSDRLPIEFTLLGIEPIPWSPAYSYALSRLMAWDMNVSWRGEVAYTSLAETVSPALLLELFPYYSDSDPTTMNEEESAAFVSVLNQTLDRDLSVKTLLDKRGTAVGSNAWAVSGERTESGMPMLAGDPHMNLNMPGYWYEVHLNVNGRNMSGATIPGAPVIVVGQNDHLAWSLTNMMADDTDFYLEIEDPAGSGRYVADSLDGEAGFAPFTVRNEIIKVKDDNDELLQIRSTDNGPVISDIFPGSGVPDNRLVTMKWTGHRVSHEIDALYRLNHSESMDQFYQALRGYDVPGQNFTYADREGNIALFSAGHLPVRDHHPLLFRHGWNSTYDWNGSIPFEELPKVVNPATGWVGNANNKLHTDSYPHYIATFWEPPARMERIGEYMYRNDILTVELLQEMQLDSYSVHARNIVDAIIPVLRIPADGYDFSQVTPYLGNWNFLYDENSTAGSIFDLFFMNLTRNTLLEKMGEETYNNFVRMENIPVRVMSRLIEEGSFLFNDTRTAVIETRNDMIRKSMDETIRWLTDVHGPEPLEWRWGNLHTLHLRPPLFAEISDSPESPRTLNLIVNNLMSKGPYPVAGHGMSLNKGQYLWSDPFQMVIGPSIRRVVDFSMPDRTWSVLPTGQSGNPISNHYGDQTELWLDGQYRYLYQDSTFFHEVSYQSMILESVR